MRRPPWLAGYLLVVSCTVNTANLNVSVGVDAGETGTGGHLTGSGGGTATGGAAGDDCPRCAPTGGATGAGGQPASGGTLGTGGQTASGGQTGAGGQLGAAGQPGAGGQPATGGQAATGGQIGAGGQVGAAGHGGPGGQLGAAGQSGTGGQLGAGGQTGTGGSAGRTCSQLQTEYTDALSAAKACTIGGGQQCRQLADTSLACPGCRVYVNDTAELDALKAQWTSSGCAQSHGVCPAIACIAPSPASCSSANTVNRGPGPAANAAGTCTTGPFGY